MNILSTPFILDDYWPEDSAEYNEIGQLNQRIDETQSELALVNANLTNDIENVFNNLNIYVGEQADTSISNNIIVNNLNANYAEGRFANFDNSFTNNAYIENLTVNKPAFDITLNTPHLENTTSLDGNFYKPNLIDARLIGDVSGDLNVVNVNQLNAVNAIIANLFVNHSASPINACSVLGYDREGRVIPVYATYNVNFPEDADYVWTDFAGTSRKGIKATEIGEVDNLITAYGVKNAIDALNTEVTDNFNLVTNALNDIDQWQNSFENSVANSFNDVNNMFNDVANSFNGVNNVLNDVANNFNDVANNFNDVANSLNDMNVATETLQSSVNESFNTFNNQLNNVESSIKTINDFMFNDIYIPEYGSFNSASPVNYTGATNVELYGNAQGGTAIPGGGGAIKFNNTTKTVTFGFSGACRIIKDANHMFNNCSSLNQNILMPNSVENAVGMFSGCKSLNQNILIPNSVKDTTGMFFNCVNLNQNILIPNSVKDASYMFDSCRNLNQNILISNSVENAFGMFYACSSLNQNILIPNSVKDASSMFDSCRNLNQNILISNSVKYASFMFNNCSSLNQNILIPNSVKDASYMFDRCRNLNQNILISNSVKYVNHMFYACSNLNQNILIPNSVENAFGMFADCSILNQNILISNSVKDTTGMFFNCVNLNQDIYIYFQNVVITGSGTSIDSMFLNTKVNLHNVHIPSSVPKDTSNNLYNCLVNGKTGLVFAPENIINDLPVDPVVWPPVD